MTTDEFSAAILVIGNEIISGYVADQNVYFLANQLSEIGINLEEVRIVPDKNDPIIYAVLELSSKYNYVFVTGGIGPTHDDITTVSIAQAFSCKLELNHDILNKLSNYHNKVLSQGVNSAIKKMAYIPCGSTWIDCLDCMPGFYIKNVYVFAGSPEIMQKAFLTIKSRLQCGVKKGTKIINVIMEESKIAIKYKMLQEKYLDVDMGSYPYKTKEGVDATSLVLSSKNSQSLQAAYNELKQLVEEVNFKNVIRIS